MQEIIFSIKTFFKFAKSVSMRQCVSKYASVFLTFPKNFIFAGSYVTCHCVCRCGKPKTSMIEMDNSDITLRLTDYNNYPHRHRSRFDNNGDHSKLFIAMVSFIKHMVLTLICVKIILI